jgi:hypothetical protein
MWNRQKYLLLESSGMGSEEIPKCCLNVARNRSIRFPMAMISFEFLAAFGMTPPARAS